MAQLNLQTTEQHPSCVCHATLPLQRHRRRSRPAAGPLIQAQRGWKELLLPCCSATATAAPAAEPLSFTVAEAPHVLRHTKPYAWAKQWYAVAFTAALDPQKLHAIELLNQRLLLWRDETGSWRCSEQVESRPAEVISQDSRPLQRPCQVRQGCVWVWGEGGPRAVEESAASPPILAPELHQEREDACMADGTELLDLGKPYARDLPYGWGYLMQNLLDPGHTNYAHHGVIGTRDKEGAGFYEIRLGKDEVASAFPEVANALGFHVTSQGFGRRTQYQMQFLAPGTVRYVMPRYFGGKYALMWMFAVPVSPGRSRILWRFLTPKDGAPPALQKQAKLPTWKDHMLRNTVFDGDTVMLAGQERLTAQAQAEGSSRKGVSPSWRSLYFMPVQADRAVVELLKWIDGRAGGGPFGKMEPIYLPASPSNKALLERFASHTSSCPDCLQALAAAERKQHLAVALLAAASIALLGLLAARLPSLVTLPLGAVLLGSSLACGRWWQKLRDTVQQFHFTGYDHAVE